MDVTDGKVRAIRLGVLWQYEGTPLVMTAVKL